jgi:hypothetical protein
MDGGQLKAAQARLKQRYRDELGAAMITLHARGAIGEAAAPFPERRPAGSGPRQFAGFGLSSAARAAGAASSNSRKLPYRFDDGSTEIAGNHL